MTRLLAAILPAALCTRWVRRSPRPDWSAQVPVLYAGRPDAPVAEEPTPIVDLTAPTLAVDVANLRRAAGLAETTVIPVVALPPDLEPVVTPAPAPWPPVRLRPDLRTTWTGGTVGPLADALGTTADLKDQASATATLPITRTLAAIQFAKTT